MDKDTEMKAGVYADLLNHHRNISNQISSIKGESIDLSPKQKEDISNLEKIQIRIMEQITNLFK